MAIKSQVNLNFKYGIFQVSYHKTRYGDCVSFSKGDLHKNVPIVRFHSACLFGEAFFSKHCDCGQQLEQTLNKIEKHGTGIVVYSYEEGRGIGLEKKIESMGIEKEYNLNTVEAFSKLGYKKHDYRNYSKNIQALKDLKVNKSIYLASSNPDKIKALEKAGYAIKDRIKFKIKLNKHNKGELILKKDKLNYYID